MIIKMIYWIKIIINSPSNTERIYYRFIFIYNINIIFTELLFNFYHIMNWTELDISIIEILVYLLNIHPILDKIY
jgi:hypothetical protein